jgi:hypothetical protein
MRLTRVAAGAGILLLGLLCWLAAAGFVVVREGLVTVFALLVLVAGGNWLSGRSARTRHVPPRPARPAGVAEAPQCPGAALARRPAREGAAGGPPPPPPPPPLSPPDRRVR